MEVFQLPMSALLKQHDDAEASRDGSRAAKGGDSGDMHMSLSPKHHSLKRTSSLFHNVSGVG